MSSPHSTTPLSGVDLHSLVDRLAVAVAHMAPHQRERQQGRLLIDCHRMLRSLDLGMMSLQGAVALGGNISEDDGQYWAYRLDGEGMWGGDSFASMVLDSVNEPVEAREK